MVHPQTKTNVLLMVHPWGKISDLKEEAKPNGMLQKNLKVDNPN